MKRFKNYLLASAGFLVLVLTLSLTGVGTSVAQTADECVRICTDEPLRVAVQNLVRIVGNVKITNGSDSPLPTKVESPVQIASSSREPLSTKLALLVSDIFQKEVEITLGPGDKLGSTSFTVPAGKLLVIEDVSGSTTYQQGSWAPLVVFYTTANNDTAPHPVFAYFGGGVWNLHTGAKAYADPGSTVNVPFARLTDKGTANLNLTFSVR